MNTPLRAERRLSVGRLLGPALLAGMAAVMAAPVSAAAVMAAPVSAAAVMASASITPTGAAPPVYGSVTTPLHQPVVGMAAAPDGAGYWLVAADGGIFSFGDSHFFGSTGAEHLNKPIVGMAPSADGAGYWLVASDGGIFSFGDSHFFGSTGAERLNQPIVGMAATPDGAGYWLVASDGGIFTFGDANFYGSTGAEHLNQPIVGMAATPDGAGYWLVAADGGIFTFGDAAYEGAAGGGPLPARVVGMAATATGHGYSLVDAGGNTYSFGDAENDRTYDNLGSSPAAGIAADPAGGFWVTAADGAVQSRGTRINPAVANPPAIANVTRFCGTSPASASCQTLQVGSLDAGRHKDGLNGVQLPANYASLTSAEQLLVLVDAERVDRGLPALAGLTQRFDSNSQQGADSHADPEFSSDPGFTAAGGLWAGADGPLQSVELWMYEDGPGGVNGDCTTAHAPGCWGHRDTILLAPPASGSTFGLAGAGASASSFAMVIEVGAGPVPQPLVFSWAQEAAAGAV